MRHWLCALIGMVTLGAAGLSEAAPAPIIIENTFLSVIIKDKPYLLQAMVVKEAGRPGRLPVALITHGVSADLDVRRNLDASSYSKSARDFARRGWLAVAVVRRGFGQSSALPSGVPGCAAGGYAPTLEAQTDDIEAALVAIAKRQDADGARAIALGVSVGGAVMLNLAARAPAGLQAVINISGGIRPSSANPAPNCLPETLNRVYAAYGAKSRLPTLWLYAENDSFFPGDYARGLHEAFAGAGGRSEFHMFPPVGQDGHNLFTLSDGLLRWLPVMDKFLRVQKLPTFDQVAMDAALKPLLISRSALDVAQRYHGRQTEKAFAVSQSGKFVYAHAGNVSTEAAIKNAVDGCEKSSNETCRAVWVNFEVVPAP